MTPLVPPVTKKEPLVLPALKDYSKKTTKHARNVSTEKETVPPVKPTETLAKLAKPLTNYLKENVSKPLVPTDKTDVKLVTLKDLNVLPVMTVNSSSKKMENQTSVTLVTTTVKLVKPKLTNVKLVMLDCT